MQIAAILIAFGSLCVSATSLAFTLREIRRNNGVGLFIESCATHGVFARDSSARDATVLELQVRNRGIALKEVQAVLEYMVNGARLSIHLVPRSGAREVELVRGMLLQCELATDRMDANTARLLGMLADVRAQRAEFAIYSQGNLAASFRVGNWDTPQDPLWRRWWLRFVEWRVERAWSDPNKTDLHLVELRWDSGRRVSDLCGACRSAVEAPEPGAHP